MTSVKVRPGESVERSLKVLKKKVDREGIMKSAKAKRYYDKPSVRKRLKSKNAQKQKFKR